MRGICQTQKSRFFTLFMLSNTADPLKACAGSLRLASNYYHSLQTLGCALPGFEVFAVFPKGLCYSFPARHCNNLNVVEKGYCKL